MFLAIRPPLTASTVPAYMNKELGLISVVRRKKPDYRKGTAHNVLENLVHQEFRAQDILYDRNVVVHWSCTVTRGAILIPVFNLKAVLDGKINEVRIVNLLHLFLGKGHGA